ncbi:unnamed protein product, partial [Mesorhabditis belari]|uniref:Uncharacterized protein n=1 Tax=Mesorhabditis belari TaxID=2138241 RepID=A0AAF3EPS3_9BILA
MRRLLPPAYDDGFDEPRWRSTYCHPLPNARPISNLECFDRTSNEHQEYMHMFINSRHSPLSPSATAPEGRTLGLLRRVTRERLFLVRF